MDERKKKVLQAIVLDYIETAEPVGSRTISRKYDIAFSPATIRNEMADLEDLGYIEQPHTSAGRIPSNQGYRYYVDCLMEKDILSEGEMQLIKEHFNFKIDEIGVLLKHTSKLLSQLTNYTALVTLPELKRGFLSNLQLVSLSPGKALMVIVTDTGFIEHKTFDLPEQLSPQTLAQISSILTEKLRGQTIIAVKANIMREIYNELARQKRSLDRVIDAINEIMSTPEKEGVLLGGTLNILNQPEYRDFSKAKGILNLLEDDDVVKEVLIEQHQEGINIRIGHEVRLHNVNDLSIVTTTYSIDGEAVGTLGLLGPTRMSYSRASALIECISENISNVLSLYTRKR